MKKTKPVDLDRRDFIKKSSGAAGLLLSANRVSQVILDAQAQLDEMQRALFARNQVSSLPYRQIHLDFHTSEHIPGVGDEFDPREFAATLRKARVNSVTCFARCHHGYMYYDTKAFPERRHPHLRRNLLGEQIEACHREGIRVPIYTTIQWDHYSARHQPDWLVLDETGKPFGTPIYEPGFYRYLCVNTPYRDFLKQHLRELFERVPVDGLFLDIVKVNECSCYYCREGMVAQKLEPSKAADRLQYATRMIADFKAEITACVRSMDKNCTIFYNGGHVGPGIRQTLGSYTHLELESLPSGAWGYLHFPLTSRYARTLGKDCLGMTGKFHTAWGDFHSLKNPAALQFECFNMLAMGAKCSIGDQLHPSGRIDPATYDLVGSVFAAVEQKEPWCRQARPLTEIGVLSPEEFVGGRMPESSLGVVRMLQEGGHQFDVIDSQSDFAGYKVLILPDVITVNVALGAKIDAFLAKGGALLASYQSGLNESKNAFALQALGVGYVGDAPYSPDFIVPRDDIGKGLPATEHVMYLKGLEVKPLLGGKVLADTRVPYFNRTYEHFSSHLHTPSAGKAGYPAVVRSRNCIYFAHPVFTQYSRNAPRWCKTMVLNALNLLLPQPLVRTNGPSSLITALNEQASDKRLVLHLLHYIPERRGKDFDTIEDILPLHQLKISVRADRPLREVAVVPQGSTLPFETESGRVTFTLPELYGHQMIALAYT